MLLHTSLLSLSMLQFILGSTGWPDGVGVDGVGVDGDGVDGDGVDGDGLGEALLLWNTKNNMIPTIATRNNNPNTIQTPIGTEYCCIFLIIYIYILF